MANDKALSRDNAIVLVLAILKDGGRHGYDIAREVERRSDRALIFKHATLYLILHEMENDNLIVSQWEHPDGERPRRVYCLTDAGRAECERCLTKWARFAEAMGKVIEGASSASA